MPAARSSTRSPGCGSTASITSWRQRRSWPEGEDVVGHVVPLRDGVEHAAYVGRVLVQVGAGHGRNLRRRVRHGPESEQPNAPKHASSLGDTERSRIPGGLRHEGTTLVLMTVLAAALLAGAAYGAGRALQHYQGDSESASTPARRAGDEPAPDATSRPPAETSAPTSRPHRPSPRAGDRARARRRRASRSASSSTAVPAGLAARADHRDVRRDHAGGGRRLPGQARAARPPASSTSGPGSGWSR